MCVLLALTACASRGVDDSSVDNTLTEKFSVDTDYQSAARRASAYFRVCYVEHEHRYNVRYDTRLTLDLKGTTTEIRLFHPSESANTLVRFSSRPSATLVGSSDITLTVLNTGIWNAGEIAAAKQSILSATPTCQPED